MIIITSNADLARINVKFSNPYAEAVHRELSQLLDMLNSEAIGPLYRIVCLEYKEPELASVGLTSPFHQVEYVEIFETHETLFYRILLMHDNECFTIVLSPKDSQNAEFEAWCCQQCRIGEE